MNAPGSACQGCSSEAWLGAHGDTVGSVPPGWSPILQVVPLPVPPKLPRGQWVVVELGRRVLGTGWGG